jgi:hypothetical protein
MAKAPTLRRVAKMGTPGIEPGGADMAKPKIRWVAPTDLLVDETYQRNLSERSVTLIRKIVADWDWCRFKPPVVTEASGGLHVLDGQHTAIAAATHPKIESIPVLVVEAADVATRAKAFLGHNRDRIQVTATQMFAAAVAAGDEDALTVKQVCDRAGVLILKNPRGGGEFKARDTMAVGAITGLVNRRGVQFARQILQALADANCAPIGAVQIRAAEMLLRDPEYAGQVELADLTTIIVQMRGTDEREAKVFAAAHNISFFRALAITWFKGRPRHGRRRAA